MVAEPIEGPEEIEVTPQPAVTRELSANERQVLEATVASIPAEVHDAFSRAYQAWKETWAEPAIVLDSSLATVTRSPEFLALINVEGDIVPLLMEKLADSEEFFALQAVEALLGPEWLSRPGTLEDEPITEQERARTTLALWLELQQ